MTDESELILSWPEVQKAIRHYLYAVKKWPAGSLFVVEPFKEGLLVERVEETPAPKTFQLVP